MKEYGRQVKSNGAYTGGIFVAADSTRANVAGKCLRPLQRGDLEACIRLKIGYSDPIVTAEGVNRFFRKLNDGMPRKSHRGRRKIIP